MFITMEEFQTQPPDRRQKPINCFVGSSGSGKTTTAVACDGCYFIPSVTDRPARPNEPPHINLGIFMRRAEILHITRGAALQEYIHASPEEFAWLDESGQFLWTYTSNQKNQYGTLRILVETALTSAGAPAIMIITPEAAIWLAMKYAPERVNCFFFEPSPRHVEIMRTRGTPQSLAPRLQEEGAWAKQVKESAIPFILVPGELRTREKAALIKKATMPKK